MNPQKSPRLLYCGGWALAGLYNFIRCALAPFPGPLSSFVSNLAWFSIWAALGLITIRMLKRYPLRMHWRPWVIHLLLAVVLTQIDITLGDLVSMHLLGWGAGLSLLDVAKQAFQNCFDLAFLHYWCFVGILLGYKAMRLDQQRLLQIEQHKTEFVRAQLQSLKSQLRPHFLFNTLHTIASLMHYDIDTAERMLNRLSELLRMSLREGATQVISLKQEIAFIEAYLDIEKIRFEHRLDVVWAIPEELHASVIPPFILQPLVENAIKHGVAPRAAGGSIVIRAYANCGALLLEVEDDAPELRKKEGGFGIGLGNTRKRLEALYGTEQGLELLRSGMRTIARIRLPLAMAAAV